MSLGSCGIAAICTKSRLNLTWFYKEPDRRKPSGSRSEFKRSRTAGAACLCVKDFRRMCHVTWGTLEDKWQNMLQQSINWRLIPNNQSLTILETTRWPMTVLLIKLPLFQVQMHEIVVTGDPVNPMVSSLFCMWKKYPAALNHCSYKRPIHLISQFPFQDSSNLQTQCKLNVNSGSIPFKATRRILPHPANPEDPKVLLWQDSLLIAWSTSSVVLSQPCNVKLYLEMF